MTDIKQGKFILGRDQSVRVRPNHIDPARLIVGQAPRVTAKLTRIEGPRQYFSLTIPASNGYPAMEGKVQVNRGDAAEAIRDAVETALAPPLEVAG